MSLPQRTAERGLVMAALAAITLFGMGGAGLWIIVGAQGRDWRQVVLGSGDPALQLAIGIAEGLAAGWLAWAFIASSWMRPVLDRYAGVIGPLLPRLPGQVLVSLCAGVGEELLFRGALQHWLGIPLTAVVFVALHGYLDPRDRRILAYGVLLCGLMIVFGIQARAHGLIAPMAAHAVIDMILINRLARHGGRSAD